MTLRVLLVDDHAVVREGLRALLASSPGLSIVGEAASLATALTLLRSASPDVVLLDLSLPDARGVAAVTAVRKAARDVAVVVLSMHDEEAHQRAARDAGADAYVVKGASIDAIVAALREVSALPVGEPSVRPALSPREREVLAAIADGHSNPVIAELLGVSPKTVETHRAHLMEKLGVRSVASLVRVAVRLGYLKP